MSVEATEGWASLGEFALLPMKRICIVYETTKCASSKSCNSIFSGFWFHFILLGLIFVSFVYFYEIYPKMSGVLV